MRTFLVVALVVDVPQLESLIDTGGRAARHRRPEQACAEQENKVRIRYFQNFSCGYFGTATITYKAQAFKLQPSRKYLAKDSIKCDKIERIQKLKKGFSNSVI